MPRYIVDDAIMLGPGAWVVESITPAEAVTWLSLGEYVSMVWYTEARDYLQRISGLKLGTCFNGAPSMAPGDEALICRLHYRWDHPLRRGPARESDWELLLVERLEEIGVPGNGQAVFRALR